jgi:1-acyl-sn-glycerol-3-phosphate acyltransferase
MIEVGLGVMVIVALLTFVTVAVVVYFGAKENLSAHIERSRAQEVWQERAERVNKARQSLVALPEGASSSGSSSASQIVSADDAEARRQAALARKAARAARSANSE